MAYIRNNIFISGVAGTLGGKMTLRVRKGKTVRSVKRGPNSTPPTDEQLAVRDKFIEAAAYARNAILDPLVKAAYAKAAKRGQTAYNAAFKDAYQAPKITKVDTRSYKGAIGDTIAISTHDVLPPVSVKVSIRSQAGDTLESGEALLDKHYWIYAATAANAALPGTRVVVEATNRPGNKTTEEFNIA